jgi:hypothetical protein
MIGQQFMPESFGGWNESNIGPAKDTHINKTCPRFHAHHVSLSLTVGIVSRYPGQIGRQVAFFQNGAAAVVTASQNNPAAGPGMQ